ncbi:MAG TPA: hypothetical protein VF760_02290 [Xanthobacteraceae bacterium]
MRRVAILQRSKPSRMLANPLCFRGTPGWGQQMQFGQLKLRDFITLISGAAAAWPRLLRQFMERAVETWQELGLGPLALRAPWYGYQLGDWSESWTEFARNAVVGDWTKNGENTFTRRRGGMSPETPVRMVETVTTPLTHG